jgi:hypothetical protein
VADLLASVEAALVGGPSNTSYGISFRQQPTPAGKTSTDGYLFLANAQGSISFWRDRADGTSTKLIDWSEAKGILQTGNKPNKLGVACKGAAVQLLINDQEVAAIPDADVTAAGRFSLFVSSTNGAGDATKVVFRNLAVLPNA